MARELTVNLVDDEKATKFWALLEKIRAYDLQVEQEDLEKELSEVRANFPNATISSSVGWRSDVDLLIPLLESEVERIEMEARRLRDQNVEARQAKLGKVVVKGDDGEIVGVQG